MPNIKYPHIKNDDIEQLLNKGMRIKEIAEFYNVKRYTIQRRIETIKTQKQNNKWYIEREIEKPIRKIAPIEQRYTPIWELPKQNGEVKIYRMDMAKITERYGRPGELRQPLPANLWSREDRV